MYKGEVFVKVGRLASRILNGPFSRFSDKGFVRDCRWLAAIECLDLNNIRFGTPKLNFNKIIIFFYQFFFITRSMLLRIRTSATFMNTNNWFPNFQMFQHCDLN